MRIIDKLKRDMAKHPARASVLGVLTVLMIALSARAVLELRPKTAQAGIPVLETPVVTDKHGSPEDTEAMDRVGESKRLWPVLREVGGIDTSVAFTFDASYYQLDPTQRRPVQPEQVETPKAVPLTPPPQDDPEAAKRARTALVREQARQLTVKSTMLGTGNSPSMAIVNQQLLTVGQEILGFVITAIKAREVEFTKDGVTIAVKMADDPRGQ
jgi:hypothetical protein